MLACPFLFFIKLRTFINFLLFFYYYYLFLLVYHYSYMTEATNSYSIPAARNLESIRAPIVIYSSFNSVGLSYNTKK